MILLLLIVLYFIPAFAILALVAYYVFDEDFREYAKPILKKPFTNGQLLKATGLAVVPIMNAVICYTALCEILTEDGWFNKPFK